VPVRVRSWLLQSQEILNANNAKKAKDAIFFSRKFASFAPFALSLRLKTSNLSSNFAKTI